jgi:hypothetical protein
MGEAAGGYTTVSAGLISRLQHHDFTFMLTRDSLGLQKPHSNRFA